MKEKLSNFNIVFWDIGDVFRFSKYKQVNEDWITEVQSAPELDFLETFHTWAFT